jgi:diguanylate cyclase (GGDEF)-like protein
MTRAAQGRPIRLFAAARPLDAAGQEEYRRIRDDLAKSETARAVLIVAALVAVLSLVNFLADPEWYPYFHLMDLAVAAVTLAFGAWATRTATPPGVVRWGFAACLTLLALNLLAQEWLAPLTETGYVLIVLCLLGPLVMDWWPFGSGAVVVVAATGVVGASLAGRDAVDWVLLAVTASVASAVLLQMRLRSLQGQARALAQAHEVAIRDPLTGVLNRRGLEEFLPGFTATAERMQQRLWVHFVDVDGLKRANDEYGHARGDEIIRSVTHALRATVRQGDLIARWGGDEFVVIGIGHERDADEFTQRVTASLDEGCADAVRGIGTVSVGCAVGDPATSSVIGLIEQADQDMYRRRARERGAVGRDPAAPPESEMS